MQINGSRYRKVMATNHETSQYIEVSQLKATQKCKSMVASELLQICRIANTNGLKGLFKYS